MCEFVHLHVHTEYSLLDGEASIKKVIAKARELGMDSLAITDHGVMYGAVDFYKEAKKNGIHPVIGCEVYVAPRSMYDKTFDYNNKSCHLVLLCENEIGYYNLIKLVSSGFIDGFYYKPRIDFELLSRYHEGLIALSACLAGEIPQALLNDNFDEALKIGRKYLNLFGKDNFFIELQDHGLMDQKKILPKLIELSKKLDCGLVATNDVHYLSRIDAKYQDVLLCIQMEKSINDETRMKFETDEFYVKSPDEMKKLFSYVPDAISNTVKIAKRCNVDFDFNTRHLPEFDVPDNKDSFEYLRELCLDGLTKRYEKVTDNLTKRLEYELGVIKQMGFVDYFLIVWDFIHYAKSHGVMVGPGRGSAAGSIVSYCLYITGIDPIKYNLIFERFLNPERVSMPDIDIDFAPNGRQKVIDYVTEKYGDEQVSQIITFGTLKAKLVIRDVARAMDIPYQTADRVAKMIPNELNITIKEALERNSELSTLFRDDEKIKELLTVSQALEGLPRHASTHAAGVVITKNAISSYVPLCKNKDSITTQYTKDTIEELGLLKMDFLGLRNLTVIENAVNIIKRTRGIDIDIESLDYTKKEVYRLISSGNTDGVFQLESDGMKAFMQELRPDCLEDIIAGIAIFRPGPMNQRHQYIHNKRHPEDITYKHPLLENILNVTNGFMVYQEQVLEIVRILAGYSLGRADVMRRVISKKKQAQMEVERNNFIYGLKDENGQIIIPGCINNGIDEKTAISIFDEINDFANYAFNKSHAAAYAVVAYQTAYLKTFYPTEFMASLISSIPDQTKINEYITNCTEMGIDRLPPDINHSEDSFTVENNGIRFGLSAVKNVGRGLIQKVVEEREMNGEFKSFSDFLERMAGTQMNKRAIEGLIKCGALDVFGVYRSRLLQIYEKAFDSILENARTNIKGQISLFEMDNSENDTVEFEYPQIDEYDKKTLLKMEKETTGMYFSGHPMDEYLNKAKKLTSINIGSVLHSVEKKDDGEYVADNNGIKDNDKISIVAMVTDIKIKTTRNNTQMAFVTIEDAFGTIEMIVFPNTYRMYGNNLKEENVIIIHATVNIREDEEPKLILNDAALIDTVEVPSNEKIYIRIPSKNPKNMTALTQILKRHHGLYPVIIVFADTGKQAVSPVELYVDGSKECIKELSECFGIQNVRRK